MRIGIDLGGSHIGVGLVEGYNLKASVDKFFSESDKQDIENAIVRNIDELIKKILSENNINLANIEKIGVASPGTVSNGKITSWNLGLKEFDLQNELEKKYNLPVKIRNDGKCAALAEKEYGAMKNYDDCVFVNIGTGIGGAAFIDGKLLEPKKYSGFEFGHMTIVKDGIQCTCGKKGCFERYASIQSLKNRIVKTLEIEGEDVSGQYLREELMVRYHNKVIDDVNDFIEYLKIGICNLIDIFEPEVVCFGGSFSYYEGHPVLKKLIEEINKPNSTFNNSKPQIVTAYFKNDAGIIGATVEK
jgi:glucokinase